MSAKAKKIADQVGFVRFDGEFGDFGLLSFTITKGTAQNASFAVKTEELSFGAVLRKAGDTVSKWAK